MLFRSLAYIARMTRSFMIEQLRQEYITTARVKGLSEARVVWRHALGNTAVPLVTVTVLSYASLLEGSVLTETVFNIPGFGKLVVDAVFNRDYAVVQGVVLCVAVGFIVMNLLADILYIVVNPRLRHS